MIHKLTAFTLALLIASPVCWCSWMHVAATQAEVPSCCQQKGDHQKHAPEKPSDCPCSKAPKVRELVSHKVLIPAPMPLADAVPAPYLDNHFPTAWRSQTALVWSTQHSPPRPAIALRVLHCSWLI